MDSSEAAHLYPSASTSAGRSSNVHRRISYASVAGAGQSSRAQGQLVAATATSPSSHPSEGETMYTSKENVVRPLPEYSRRYAGRTGLVVPSYLKKSRYMEKLVRSQANRERLAAGAGPGSTTGTSTFSNTTSATNVQRLAPSHRGMTYDIIESNPPRDEDDLIPLPSRWNNQDKYPGLEVTNDGLDVKYSGSAGKAETEAASVRADYPMSPACGIFYFEVQIKQNSKDTAVAVGFSTLRASLERLPGWEADSWAYHGDDGRSFSGEQNGRNYGPTFAAGDIIGCGLNFLTGQAFFTRNGMDLGVAFRDLKHVKPFPSVGIKKYSGAIVSVNFGAKPFVYDIDSKVEDERAAIRMEIQKTKTTMLHPGLSEQSLVQELVAQFLSHGGYVETAAAFAEQRKAERKALDETRPSSEESAEADSTSAIYRQQIRRAILSGDISLALQVTDRHFPNVLRDSPEILFRLKCRKWVELISQASDLRTRQGGYKLDKSNGLSSDSAAKTAVEGLDLKMEVDEDQQSAYPSNSNVGSVSTASGDNDLVYNQLMTEAMNYGQILQREYRDEANPEYRRTLAAIFSLVAYTEPRESVHGHLLESDGRLKVAEELNSAILVSLGRSPSAALEKIFTQTEALIEILSQEGGPASFVNIKSDFDSEVC